VTPPHAISSTSRISTVVVKIINFTTPIMGRYCGQVNDIHDYCRDTVVKLIILMTTVEIPPVELIACGGVTRHLFFIQGSRMPDYIICCKKSSEPIFWCPFQLETGPCNLRLFPLAGCMHDCIILPHLPSSHECVHTSKTVCTSCHVFIIVVFMSCVVHVMCS
jgi:hypothetical protein